MQNHRAFRDAKMLVQDNQMKRATSALNGDRVRRKKETIPSPDQWVKSVRQQAIRAHTRGDVSYMYSESSGMERLEVKRKMDSDTPSMDIDLTDHSETLSHNRSKAFEIRR